MRIVVALLLVLAAAVRSAPVAERLFVAWGASGATSDGPARPAPSDDRLHVDDADPADVAIRETRTPQHRVNLQSWSALPRVDVADPLPPIPSMVFVAGLAPAVPRVHVAQHGARSPPA